MAPPLEILCITTGGSIDKTYSSLASDFVCAAPVLKGLLRDVKCAHRVAFKEICRKDSLELTDGDRDAVVAAVAGAAQTHVLVTHGTDRAGQESEIPNFKGSVLGRFPLVSADFWTSDHLSERSRSVDVFFGTRARGTLTLKRR